MIFDVNPPRGVAPGLRVLSRWDMCIKLKYNTVEPISHSVYDEQDKITLILISCQKNQCSLGKLGPVKEWGRSLF
jgi:hypothetical protein